MKRKILLVAVVTSLAIPQEVHAQKWLKKLGNIAKSVLLDDHESTTSQQSSSYNSNKSISPQSSSNKVSSASANARVSDISASVTDITRFAKNWVRVGFVLHNQGSTNLCPTIKLSKAKFAGMSQPLESTYIKIDASGYNCLLDYQSITDLHSVLPASSNLKGYMIFEEVPQNVTVLERLDVNMINLATKDKGITFEEDINSPIVTKSATGGIIREFPASIPSGSICTYPDFTLKINSLRRNGNKAVLSFTLTNITSSIIRYNLGDWVAYDDSGTSYKPKGLALDMSTQGIETLYSSNGFNFLPGTSRSFTLTISNVPTSISAFSLIKIPIHLYDFGYNSIDPHVSLDISIRNTKFAVASR